MDDSDWYQNYTLRNMRGDFDIDWDSFSETPQPKRRISLNEYRERRIAYDKTVIFEENVLEMLTPFSDIEESSAPATIVPNNPSNCDLVTDSARSSKPTWALYPLEPNHLATHHWKLIQECRLRSTSCNQFSVPPAQPTTSATSGQRDDNPQRSRPVDQPRRKSKPTGKNCRKRQKAKRLALFRHKKMMERKEKDDQLYL